MGSRDKEEPSQNLKTQKDPYGENRSIKNHTKNYKLKLVTSTKEK